MRNENLRRVCLIAIIGLVAAAAVADAEELAQSDQAIVNTGQHIYAVKCAVCHGEDGRGNGPYTPMLYDKPTDLTALAKRSGGAFPSAEIYETISGAELLPAHGTRDMPIWGQEISGEALDGGFEVAPFVRARILALIAYLESIQQE
jgi:mono/diheme cytochrome c family protein